MTDREWPLPTYEQCMERKGRYDRNSGRWSDDDGHWLTLEHSLLYLSTVAVHSPGGECRKVFPDTISPTDGLENFRLWLEAVHKYQGISCSCSEFPWVIEVP